MITVTALKFSIRNNQHRCNNDKVQNNCNFVSAKNYSCFNLLLGWLSPIFLLRESTSKDKTLFFIFSTLISTTNNKAKICQYQSEGNTTQVYTYQTIRTHIRQSYNNLDHIVYIFMCSYTILILSVVKGWQMKRNCIFERPMYIEITWWCAKQYQGHNTYFLKLDVLPININ